MTTTGERLAGKTPPHVARWGADAGRVAALVELGLALSSTLDLDALLSLVVERAAQLLGAGGATLFLVDRPSGELWSKIVRGEKVREIARAQMQGASAEDARAAYQKVLTDTDRVAYTVSYERAKALLDAGKAAEAGQLFEALANEQGGDQAAALVGAAIAADKAGNPDHAAELRERVVVPGRAALPLREEARGGAGRFPGRGRGAAPLHARREETGGGPRKQPKQLGAAAGRRKPAR